jgi:branched-chain amino acid transport system permease protein
MKAAQLVRVTPARVAIVAVTVLLVALPLYESGGDIGGVLRYLNMVAIQMVIFAIIAIGLNVQLGYAGITNFGVAAFFLLGSYVAAIFVLPPSTSSFITYIGGFGEVFDFAPGLRTEEWAPFVVAVIASGASCAVLAVLLSLLTPRLKADYLAIATIGVAELLRATANIEVQIVNGDRGLLGIPRPAAGLFTPQAYPVIMLIIELVVLAGVYFYTERAVRSPWGRVLRAAREDEVATASVGKNVFAFRMKSFVLGAVLMGIAAAFFAFSQGALTPTYFQPLQGTFIFWVMLIVGGVGSNKGAVTGAYVVWGLWTITLQVQSLSAIPPVISDRIPFLRLVLLGGLFIVMLLARPEGLVPEERRVSRWLGRLTKPAATTPANEQREVPSELGNEVPR